MKFLAVPLEDAEGQILGHNVSGATGRRALRKGKALTARDLQTLRRLGRTSVYVAKLESGDVAENEAARRIAEAAAGEGLRLSRAQTGRVNLYAETLGLLRLDLERLTAVNSCSGITLATLRQHSVVGSGRMLATLKILPYAVPEATVAEAEALARFPSPLVHLTALPRRRVGLVLSGSPAARERVEAGFRTALRDRLEALGSALGRVDYVPLEDEADEVELAEALQRQQAEGAELVLLAGETAIMDRFDIAPRAVERAGGRVECFGAPVDPGNLLLLADLEGMPVIGTPGCSRSPKKNIVDLVLPRLLAGDRLTVADVVALGHGGLLEDVPERPLPRSWLT